MNSSTEFNEKKLEFLRKNTILDPISILRIQRVNAQMEKCRKWYLEAEGELLSSDYTMADRLEYELRLRAWERSWYKEWEKNSDGLSLSEFADMILQQKIIELPKSKIKLKRQ